MRWVCFSIRRCLCLAMMCVCNLASCLITSVTHLDEELIHTLQESGERGGPKREDQTRETAGKTASGSSEAEGKMKEELEGTRGK